MCRLQIMTFPNVTQFANSVRLFLKPLWLCSNNPFYLLMIRLNTTHHLPNIILPFLILREPSIFLFVSERWNLPNLDSTWSTMVIWSGSNKWDIKENLLVKFLGNLFLKGNEINRQHASFFFLFFLFFVSFPSLFFFSRWWTH